MSTVGDVISQLTSSVNAFIENQNKDLKAPRSTAIELATDVSIAIGNAQTAWTYSGELTAVEIKADQKVRDQLTILRDFVEALGSQETFSAANLASHVRRFNESLSLPIWQPKLKDIFSRYVFAQQSHTYPRYGFEVSFHGNFECAGKNLKGCSLSFPDFEGHVSIQPSALTDTLTFKITGLKKEFFSQIPKEGCKFVKGVLTVQYDAGRLLSDIRQAIYGIWIGIYPLTPGQITLTYPVEKVVAVKEQPFRSPTMNLARAHFPNEEIRERKITFYPTPGWKIKMFDPPKLFCNGGSSNIGHEDFNEHVFNATLKLPEGQEKDDYWVTFTEMKEIREMRDHAEQVDLEWGKYHPIPSNKFAVHFNSFDGQIFDFTSDDIKKIPYLKVRDFQNGYELVAEVPKRNA